LRCKKNSSECRYERPLKRGPKPKLRNYFITLEGKNQENIIQQSGITLQTKGLESFYQHPRRLDEGDTFSLHLAQNSLELCLKSYDEHQLPKLSWNESDQNMSSLANWLDFCNSKPSEEQLTNFPIERLCTILVCGLKLVIGVKAFGTEHMSNIYENSIESLLHYLQNKITDESAEPIAFCHVLWSCYLANFKKYSPNQTMEKKKAINSILFAGKSIRNFPEKISPEIMMSSFCMISVIPGACQTDEERIIWLNEAAKICLRPNLSRTVTSFAISTWALYLTGNRNPKVLRIMEDIGEKIEPRISGKNITDLSSKMAYYGGKALLAMMTSNSPVAPYWAEKNLEYIPTFREKNSKLSLEHGVGFVCAMAVCVECNRREAVATAYKQLQTFDMPGAVHCFIEVLISKKLNAKNAVVTEVPISGMDQIIQETEKLVVYEKN